MQPSLEFVCEFAVTVSAPQELGDCGAGTRRIIPIAGGSVTGPALNGRILGVGADWQTVEPGTIARLDARYAIETDDGALIEVTSQGIRHMPADVAARVQAGEAVPFSDYYMRTVIWLNSSHPDYTWVNRAMFLASGGKQGQAVKLSIYRVT
ncbi:MAG: hypothetical protein RLZZ427_1795 [Pseudomonadota bacterium]|jgi:hypothetical protein